MIIRKLSRITKGYPAIASTNEEMQRLIGMEAMEEGTVIRADYQTAGKGHQGNTWSSERGKNLLFSILLKPKSLPPGTVFHLSGIVSLSLVDILDQRNIRTWIKWPNDILAGSKKICGILIENSITGYRISDSVIGIGLNVNQEKFNEGIPSPTSMFLEKRCQFDMNLLLEDFRSALEAWYRELLSGNTGMIMDAYHSRLYLKGTRARYSDGKSVFMGRIVGVLPGGELEMELDGGEIRRFGFKQIEYLD